MRSGFGMSSITLILVSCPGINLESEGGSDLEFCGYESIKAVQLRDDRLDASEKR